jgi:hypothetical protein
VCFELVNYLNTQRRKEASVDDVNLAAEKVLTSANPYFDYIWNIECTNSEREFLHQMIKNGYIKGNQKEIDSLLRKEIMEKIRNGYKFKVELMKKWIEKNEIHK